MNASLLRSMRGLLGDGRVISALLGAVSFGAVFAYDYLHDILHHYLVNDTYVEVGRTYVVPPPMTAQEAMPPAKGGKTGPPAASLDPAQQMKAEIAKALNHPVSGYLAPTVSPNAVASIVTVLVSTDRNKAAKEKHNLRFSVPAGRFYGIAITGAEPDDTVQFEEGQKTAAITLGKKNTAKDFVAITLAFEGVSGEFTLNSHKNRTDKIVGAGLMTALILTGAISILGIAMLGMTFSLHRKIMSVRDCNDVQNTQLNELSSSLSRNQGQLESHGAALEDIRNSVLHICAAIVNQQAGSGEKPSSAEQELDRLVATSIDAGINEDVIKRYADIAASQAKRARRASNINSVLGGAADELRKHD